MPTVSVVIPSCNHDASLAAAMLSVLDQSLSDVKLIVVDYRSSDDSLQIAERAANGAGYSDPRLPVFA